MTTRYPQPAFKMPGYGEWIYHDATGMPMDVKSHDNVAYTTRANTHPQIRVAGNLNWWELGDLSISYFALLQGHPYYTKRGMTKPEPTTPTNLNTAGMDELTEWGMF